MKKLLSLLSVFVLVFACVLPAFAEEAAPAPESFPIEEPPIRDTEIIYIDENLEDGSGLLSSVSSYTVVLTSDMTSAEVLSAFCAAIRSGLLNGESSFYIYCRNSSYMDETAELQFSHINYYCPYLNGTDTECGIYRYSNTGTLAYVLVTSSLTAAEAENWVAGIDAKLGELSQLIGSVSSVSDKALVLHDYMDAHYHYDTTYKSYYPAILLTDGKGVCQSYAYLFQYVMNQAGIECYTTVTDTHAWNIIRIGSAYYHIDATWDDPIYDCFGQAQHNYFLITDESITDDGDHLDWDLADSYPCTDSSYESAYFTEAVTPVIFDGSSRYYITDSPALMRYDVVSCSSSLAASLSRWRVWGSSNAQWGGAFTGLFEYGGKLYYNEYDCIKAYDLSSGTVEIYAEIDVTDGYAYGLLCEGSAAYYECSQKPSVDYNSKDIRSVALPVTAALLPGDADCSGIVDAADLSAVIFSLAGRSTLTAQGLKNADINSSGSIDAEDFILIVKYLCGIASAL